MSDTITHRLSAEGADPVLLTGINDTNLTELERVTGVRASLRGDQVMLAGELEAVERAARVASAMIDIARVGEALSPEDIRRLVVEGGTGLERLADGELKIVLPGLRRIVHPKTAGQREYVKALRDHEIVIGVGPAGTGKTYLAVAVGVEALARKRVRRLVLARPAVEAGERLGFLPGDIQAKVDPYLRPLYDALEDMMPQDRIQKALETRTIEIAPLAYMRGRTLADAFVILDEAQNVTGGQMKMFLTRLGVNSRAVVIGDKTQIDLPSREESGLIQVERILPGIEGVAFCYLDDRDVVRHRLVREIIRAYVEDQGT
ncbi:MAG TPA: PhoH family protein [Gemmatimonadales bacterium]|jgi:phosphate starvation-inducible PhoH-like protein|nr:PhoH family protein [Gemmatimonadales bacterium]